MLFLCLNQRIQAQKDKITYPINGAVYQQNNGSQNINIAGQLTSNGTFKYRIDKKTTENGTWSEVNKDQSLSITNWASSGIRGGFYSNPISLTKAWYRIRLYKTITILGFTLRKKSVDRVEFGIGDVYYIAGQSNAAGYLTSGTIPDDNNVPYHNIGSNSFSRKLDLITNSSNGNNNLDLNYSNSLNYGLPLRSSTDYPAKFSKLENGNSTNKEGIYPSGGASWCWPKVGKTLGDQGTPTMFFNTANPGSSVLGYNGVGTGPWSDDNQLAGRFKRTLQTYGNIFGAKGVLWHQGETDAAYMSHSGINKSDYAVNYQTAMNSLISNSRSILDNTSNLNWFVAKAGYTTGQNSDNGDGIGSSPVYNTSFISNYAPIDQNRPRKEISNDLNPSNLNSIYDAQASLINTANNIYSGPDSDQIGILNDVNGRKAPETKRSSKWRVHFSGADLGDLADSWITAINNANSGTSVSPTNLIKLNDVSATGNNYTIIINAQVSGSQYYWVKNDAGMYNSSAVNSASNSHTFGNCSPGDYLLCYVKLPNGRVLASQPFKVPGSIDETNAIIVSNENLAYNSNSTTQFIEVNALNVDWDINSKPDWLSINYNDDNENLEITTQNNTNSSSRSGVIIIKDVNSTLSKSISVVQQGIQLVNTPLTTLTPTSNNQGWGTLHTDGLNCAGSNVLTVSGQPFTQGIGTHAPGNLSYYIPAGYSTFTGKVGRDDAADLCGCGMMTSNFRIKWNGNVVWSSQMHGTNTDAESFSINLGGAAGTLELLSEVGDGDYLNYGDWSDWINPMLNTTAGGSGGTPSAPYNISANPSTINSGQSSSLSAACATGVVSWSNNQTGTSISVSPSVTTTYTVKCMNGSLYSTSQSVTVTVNAAPSGSCGTLSNQLVMGTWNVTGSQLVSRYFHNNYWLVQKANIHGSQYDEFIVRASEMLTRSDVALNNSNYTTLVNCYSWQYSGYGGLVCPNATSTPAFPTPVGYYLYYTSDGTPYYSNWTSTANACDNLTNNLVMGIWTVTGHQLINRIFNNQRWLVQKVNVNGGQYDEFVMRGSAMLQRSDVNLNSSSYYNLINCYGWIYSNYGNLEGPPASTFPTPSGYYAKVASDGTPYYTNFAGAARLGVEQQASTAEELTPLLSVFPNPTQGEFEAVIFLNEAGDYHISLVSGDGKELFNKVNYGDKGFNKFPIKMTSGTTSGVYILKVVSKSGIKTVKVNKQ